MSVVDVKVSSGQLDISKEKNLLVWLLGKHCADCKESLSLQLNIQKRN